MDTSSGAATAGGSGRPDGVPHRDGGAGPQRGTRLTGVDAARGLALTGMMAVHILPARDPVSYDPSLAWTLFSGRSAALFALLAGVGLAFSTGGRRRHRGRTTTADGVGLVVRAALIAVLGLLLNTLLPDEAPAYNILVYYGMFFLLALPFLHLPAAALGLLAAAAAVAGPVLVQLLRDDLPEPVSANPDLADVLAEPGAVLAQLLLTGAYPALPYLAYLLAGLAIGRLDLSSRRVQGRLIGAGLAVTLSAWLTYRLLLVEGGGYARLLEATPWMSEEQLDAVVLWGPNPDLPTTSWWWLLVPGPHSNTPVSVLEDLGTGMVALGVLLLVTRRAGAWLLPLVAMGSMTLTLYSAHLAGLSAMVHGSAPVLWFLVHLELAALVAVLWRRSLGQGPLERVVGGAVRAARRAVLPEK
ncbi:hypothetical protein GCM10011374_04440 [Kocuria dechangensis]|uniref:Heparan-alpha-glucosaminide N-acetyltransferase catalytic domain-containing protein n=1 Tax=Kocuria dechangensis TaxID=1176249 RepID=A0A917GH15_9MICC|nr:heparan-alpha-glucosaminide N-acetyltransferase domain-containing protein [Kocuria dechangensis]GGG45237.1 hypothetical protein GCM10011374_04440 [Kocuria dechangensis]